MSQNWAGPRRARVVHLRREVGSHSNFAGRHLQAYANEMSWREDNRRVSNGELYLMTAKAALGHPVSRQWKGYWQRRVA